MFYDEHANWIEEERASATANYRENEAINWVDKTNFIYSKIISYEENDDEDGKKETVVYLLGNYFVCAYDRRISFEILLYFAFRARRAQSNLIEWKFAVHREKKIKSVR